MVKDEDVGRILKAFHGDKAGGCHFGVTTTFTKLSERFWWKGMYDNVLKLVNSCLQCQQRNVVKKGPSELHPVPVPDRCFAQWGMDLVGPLKQTESGMEYIIVFTEYMTRWAEARAIPSKSALNVSSAVVECLISRFGCPETIITDQGREFVNSVNEQLCGDMDIHHRICSAYHPQTNGLTERLNQTLVAQLRKMVDGTQSNWDTLLPWILMSYRANTQASTKQSPYFLVYVKQMRLPIELESKSSSIPDSEEQQGVQLVQRIANLSHLQSFCLAGRSNIQKAQAKQKELYDVRHQPPKYKSGDCVWYRNSRRDTRKGGKLDSVWAGRSKIAVVLEKGTYKLEGLSRIYNATQLKPVVEIISESNPQELATGITTPNPDSSGSPDTSSHSTLQLKPVALAVCITTPNPDSSRPPDTSTHSTTAPEVVVCVREIKNNANHIFHPPNIAWQRLICKQSGGKLVLKKKSGPSGRVLNTELNTFSAPTRTRKVDGDENCYFRCISYIVTGDEESHEEVRQLVCDYIEQSPQKYDQDSDGRAYLCRSQMCTPGIWASIDEILATANLLGIPVFVRSAFGSRLAWQKHSPCDRKVGAESALYLDNSSSCHFDVVTSIGMK